VATPTQFRRGGRWSLIFGALVATLMLVAVAAADDIFNNLDGTIDANFEVMSLNVGGANGTTTLAVFTQGGDGHPGCNFQGSETLTVAVSSSNTGVATVSPSSLTFGSCADTKTLTVTPVAQGAANVTLSQTSNNTGDTFNFDTARFTVNVAPPPNTPPTVSVTGVTHGASYAKGSVPTAGCLVSDTEDGLTDSTSAATPTLSAFSGPYVADGIGTQTAECSYTDGGGLNQTVQATYTVYDPSGPTIGTTITGTLGSNGWYTSNVDLVWVVGDPQSPSSVVKSGCVDQHVTADQDNTGSPYTCSATSAGGSSGPVSVVIKRDATAPSVSCGSADSDWHADDQQIACTATDAPSGLANAGDAAFSLTTSVAANTEPNNASTNSHDVYDVAGNFTTAGPVSGIKVDKKAPTLNCDSAPSGWSATQVTINCTADDGGSGLANASDANFGLSTTVSPGTETDNASTGSKTLADDVGNSTTAGPVTGIKVDRKAPTYSCDSAPTTWSANDVTINCTAQDGGSGLADSSDASFTLSTSVSAGTETSNASTGTKTIADAVGNSLTAGPVNGAMVDKKGPSVSLTCPTNVILGSSASASWTAADGGSGVASGYGSGTITGLDTSTIGTKTATAPAGTSQDKVGNSSPQSTCNYSVIYNWTGFFQPVDSTPVNGVLPLNVSKAGSAIPVKFSLHGNQGLNIFWAGYPTSNVAACDAAATEDVVEVTVTAGQSSLNYDATADQYVYVWKTDKLWAGTCRQLRVKLADGTLHAANFKLTK
jgi:hypothetical protein